MNSKKTEMEKRAQKRLNNLPKGGKTAGMSDYHMEDGHIIIRNESKVKMSKKERIRQRKEALDRYWD